MTNARQPSRSVARDPHAREGDEPTPAEQIRAYLTELHEQVDTHEKVLRYRAVNRGRRQVLIPDFVQHRIRRPGLLAQLGTVQATADTATVDVWRWRRDDDDPCQHGEGPPRECAHGRWIFVRTEQRPIAGVITVGAAVPGGSPGWDEDGALSPTVRGGKPDAAEPVTDAWHTAEDIRADLAALGRTLHADGWRPPATLVTIALADADTGRRIVRQLHALVARARIAAGYDAAKVPLRDVYCPECGGQMMVRKDASSAVWCEGRVPLHGPALDGEPWPIGWERCGAKWPRGHWLRLLEEATHDKQKAAS